MDPYVVLQQLGGSASAARLRRYCPRRGIARAVAEGRIIRSGAGRYALPGLEAAWRHADRLHAVVSGASAAHFWGLALRLGPGEEVPPTVTVPRNRNVRPERREGVSVTWRALGSEDVVEGAIAGTDRVAPSPVTTLVRTVIDCCRDMPELAALCIVDSALGRGVSRDVLLGAADAIPRKGRGRARRIIELGDGRAANAFETCLRDLTRQVAGLNAVPQVQIGQHRVDLADTELRIVIEAESYAFHGSKPMFRSDTRRYTALVVDDWMVLRFVWEDVMLAPERVLVALEQAVALRRRRMQAG